MAASNVPFTTPGNMYGRTAEFPGANSLEHTTGGSAGDNKLWLPIWSGEVMRAFDQYRMFNARGQRSCSTETRHSTR